MDFDLVSRLLFPAPPASYTVDSFPGELIWIPRSLNPQTSSPEDCIPCALLRCKTAQLLFIYLHSNYEDLGRSYGFLGQLRDRFQVHVLAVEYPGYGICPGTRCDERGATESALTAFRFAREVLRWPLDRIIFLGRSIGTGPAITLAVEHAVKGVCLISPFLSVREVCKDVFGPVSYMIEERFPNKDHMPLIRSPCLVVHGQKDLTIPFRHGRELFNSCRSPKRLVSPPDMDHNSNLLRHAADFVTPMLEFFSLPLQGLEEMQVPSWAFDKRLSPFFCQGPEKPLSAAKLLPGSLFGTCAPCTACGKCALGPTQRQVSAKSGRWDGDALVEETITGAIEHVLTRKEELVWAEADTESDMLDSPGKEGPQALPLASSILAGKYSLGGPASMLPVGGVGNVLPSDLPMPPSDDAVPVVPHTTVRRHPGRPPWQISEEDDIDEDQVEVLKHFGITIEGTSAKPGSIRSFPGNSSIGARPMMSWRPHTPVSKVSTKAPAKIQSLDDPDPEALLPDIVDDGDGGTLIRI